jgi:hypothetical protein
LETSDSGVPSVTDLGYYYSDWIWGERSINFMKSMLLFFDGLALALPSHLAAEVIDRDPVLAAPLAEKELLVNFDPVSTLDANAAERLATTLTEVVERFPMHLLTPGAFILTDTHWGQGSAQRGVVEAFERALAERGLISPKGSDGLYTIQSDMRFLILTMFAQSLRVQLGDRGIVLHPATDSAADAERIDWILYHYLRALPNDERHELALNAAGFGRLLPYVDRMNPLHLAADLDGVGADLSAVPLDEVLSFRAENGHHYRAYARALREFLASLAQASPAERLRINQEREAEIQDEVMALRRISRTAFGTRMATLFLSLAGAAWTLHTGDPIGAMIAGSAAGLQAAPTPGQTVTAYSYLLRARDLGSR